MIDQEMLQAIAAAMDEKLRDAAAPVRQDIGALKQDLGGINARLDRMEGRLDGLEREVCGLRDELRRVAVKQENEVIPRIQLLFENQTKIIDEHSEMERLDTNLQILKDNIDALNYVTKPHTKEIARLKKVQ